MAQQHETSQLRAHRKSRHDATFERQLTVILVDNAVHAQRQRTHLQAVSQPQSTLFRSLKISQLLAHIDASKIDYEMFET